MVSEQPGDQALQASLAALAVRLAPDARGIGGLQRLSGGATQEIWRFTLQAPSGEVPLVLRRSPAGEQVFGIGIGLDVEARLMSAAQAQGVPVPPVRYVLAPEDGLGEGFIMGFVAGETLGGRIVKSKALAAVRQTLATRCGTILAQIHEIPSAQFPTLVQYSPAALVAQWQESFRSISGARPVFEGALRWLASHCPRPAERPRLVHGDFRNGNLMIGPDGVRAVLDWELAHIGDPMEDLGWICVNSWRFGVIDQPVGGFGTREDLWAGYEAAGGAAVDRDAAKWWEVFGTLRWGVMCAGALPAFRGGDPTVERALIARRASETEIDLLRLLRE